MWDLRTFCNVQINPLTNRTQIRLHTKCGFLFVFRGWISQVFPFWSSAAVISLQHLFSHYDKSDTSHSCADRTNSTLPPALYDSGLPKSFKFQQKVLDNIYFWWLWILTPSYYYHNYAISIGGKTVLLSRSSQGLWFWMWNLLFLPMNGAFVSWKCAFNLSTRLWTNRCCR